MAAVTMMLIRKRREADDDPLSPITVHEEKGFSSGAAAGAGHNAPRAMNNTTGYSNNAQTTADAATPPAGNVNTTVAYTQFYDAPTSPASARRTSPESVKSDNQVNNESNLWLSAMESHSNSSYTSGSELRDKRDSDYGNRNSYDQGTSFDNHSLLSSGSSLHKAEYPDYEDERLSRGSYEL